MAEVEGRPAADLAVSDVVHKAYEKVDEKGTEAAAVTAVIVGVSAPIETKCAAWTCGGGAWAHCARL